MGYHALWHFQASLLFPTMTIHQIVNLTKMTLNKTLWLNSTAKRVLPATMALSAIPFLIHPLNNLADFIMEHTYCRIANIDNKLLKHKKL